MMGPKNAIALVMVLVCCMMISNGKYAVKTRNNEMPTEKRKIVKLLLRNFPLQESASYHNLVEDDEVGQPVAKGNHMTQYAPAYPYQEESMSSNQVNAFKFQEPTTKLVKKTKPDLSKFEYALSTILLPPPIPSDLPSLSSSFLNEENADKYYAPYMKNNEYEKYFLKPEHSNEDNADVFYAPYTSSLSGNIRLIPTTSIEENADQYYAPYMKYEQPNSENTADEYYLPYNQYAQQQQDDWLQYYRHNSEDSSYESFGELPTHSLDVLYEGPREEQIDIDFKELPTLQEGNQFSGPTSIDNEIFDVPKVFLKLQQ
eukprot:TRINITY_DN1199_c0_g1_i18.p1 TRINITY_DN1199_c0_g1~~TRINITY_DN1199_c0_g1_i18.p1  ORF type:complete len:315 (+),score=68.84 TRINITY_DN1199_c0_g1_i18:182-1126(+)